MKKSTKLFLLGVGATITGIYVYNRFIEQTATKNNLLKDTHGEYYSWKHGNIFYTKTGNGSPILLVHDLNSTASAEEWKKIIHRLEKKHTVYTLDLLGCGRSDKPAMEYANYLYVQLLTDFVKEIIQEKTTVVATNMSASSIILANHIDNELFEKMIFINPVPLADLEILPDEKSKFKKLLIQFPFIGTFIYNIMNNSHKIDAAFRNDYYEKAQLISSTMEDIYYEAAHLDGSNGRYLYSSMIGNYLNNGVVHALKNITTPTLIIGSREMNKYSLALDDYHKVNQSIEIVKLTNGNLYPHMEVPEKVYTVIEDYLK
ncbi:MAG: alpha/beta fold hydrolase [Agathobacter sp.]|nr:alpha/beta fold hydrolase [Agathobacter sp.]